MSGTAAMMSSGEPISMETIRKGVIGGRSPASSWEASTMISVNASRLSWAADATRRGPGFCGAALAAL